MAQISKEELEEQRQTAMKVLVSSYQMYEKSLADMEEKRNGNPMYSEKETKKAKQLMETMKKDVVSRYVQLGGTEEELIAKASIKGKKKKGIDRTALEDIMKKENAKEEMAQRLQEMRSKTVADIDSKIVEEKTVEEEKNEAISPSDIMNMTSNPEVEPVIAIPTPNVKETEEVKENFAIKDNTAERVSNQNNRIQWDNVPLPSHGECYRQKLDKLPVAYLTAYDENLIVSPNLYKDGTFLDELLKSKIMTSYITADELLPGDRDAIILWLRGTSYGTDFPVSATDNETGKQFDTTVDLTTIKAKEFKLKGDINGYFDFTLPVSNDKIKFKFLTYKDLKELEEMEANEMVGIKKEKLTTIIDELSTIVNNDTTYDKQLKKKLTDGIKNFENYRDSLEEDEKAFSHGITNKLIKSIVAVNNITDRRFIEEYVMNMNVKDSSALRRYITENEPGLDFNIEVERPESLGGGSVRMFLTLDQFIFLNIA